MAGDYIQVDHELIQKPEFLAIRGKTGLPADVVLGRLILLWIMADRQTTDGVIPYLDAGALAVSLGGDAAFWQAVASVGWLELSETGAAIPAFEERFGRSARRRIQEAKRKSQRRLGGRGADTADKERTQCGHNADTVRTGSGHGADTERTTDGGGPQNTPQTRGRPPDRVRTECGQSGRGGGQKADCPPLSVSVSKPVSDPTPEPGSTLDQKFSWSKNERDLTLSLAQRKFTQSRLFPERPQPSDRLLLLKTAALCVAGRLSESVIDEGLQAIKHHNPAVHGEIRNPITYFHAVLSEKTGGTYAALLDDLTVPADLAKPPTKGTL